MIFRDGEGTVAGSFVDDLHFDRSVDGYRGIIYPFQNDVGAICGKMGGIIVVMIQQICTCGGTGLVEVRNRYLAAGTGYLHAHGWPADHSGAVCLEANGVLPGVGGNQLTLIDDQTDRDTA